MNKGQKPKIVYHRPEPGERQLWPSDEYRQKGQSLEDQVIRVLWPSAEYRSEVQ